MTQVSEEIERIDDAVNGATIVLASAKTKECNEIEQILTRDGLTVRSARTDQHIIQTISEAPPDLIVMDVDLPESGGLKLCSRIKTKSRFRNTPIVFLGDINSVTERGRAFAAGGDDWILKPVAPEELLTKVRNHLKRSFLYNSFAARDDLARRKNGTNEERALKKHRDHLEATVKECTAQLTIAKEQSKAAEIARNVFLSHMSHELRTPLNAILGFSRLMERDANLTEKQAENLDLIHQSGEHLLNLINDVLAMAKTNAGREALDIATLDLPQFIESIAAMCKNRAVGHGLTFSLDVKPGMPRYVKCDERKLQQILTNLIDNSIKFTETGGIELRVWSPHYNQKNKNDTSNKKKGKIALYFEVIDSGMGIAAEMLETIFDPFFSERIRGAAKTGTGLGLTISRNFARLMGGDITAASHQGKGAHFTFHVSAEPASPPMEKVHYRVTGIDHGKTGQRILVVDDNGTSRLLLSELLNDVGFKVKEAEDGRKAVALFFKWRPHLIFMDIRMPLMDGMAATKIIKATEEGKYVPIIALTAHAIEEERKNIIAAGCEAFIRKPFEESELFQVMAKHLDLAFILKKANHPPASTRQPSSRNSIEALSGLPLSLLESLNQSSIALDVEKINTCIDEILKDQSELGDALKSLSKRFRYNEIYKLTEAAIKEKK